MENSDVPKFGIVKKIYDNNMVEISMKPHSVCSGCGACGLFSGLNDSKEQHIKLRCRIDVKVNDVVEYKNSESGELTASLLLFFVPILMFIFGMGASFVFSKNQLYMFFSGTFFMGITFLILKFLEKKDLFTWMLPIVVRNLSE